MNALLSIVVALSLVAIPPAVVSAPAASQPAPVVAMACGDWLDLGVLLDDPRVETRVLGALQNGDTTVIVAEHRLRAADGSSDCVWVGFYAFPSTIFAHSIVTVPFHADEMD